MAIFTEKGQGVPETEAGLSIIGTGMRVVGDITAEGVVKIEGAVVGTVRSSPPAWCTATSPRSGCWCRRAGKSTGSCGWGRARWRPRWFRRGGRGRGQNARTDTGRRYPHAQVFGVWILYLS